ncbi:hypothetical protein BH23BAC3_BH23BAC3_30140 [soil metagenome]
MNSIEFVGPSGIGKTTFLQALVKERGNARWITRDEGLRLVSIERFNIIEKVIVKTARLFGLSLTLKKNEEYLEKIKHNDASCSLLVDLFIENLHNSGANAWQKVHRFDYYLKTILNQYILLHESLRNKTIVFDEGIIHSGGFKIILENYEKYKDIPESEIFPKAAIFFDLNIDQYRERLYARFNERGDRTINSLKVNVTDEELERYMSGSKKGAYKKLVACKMLKIPILEIEPLPTKENISSALSLINEINEK